MKKRFYLLILIFASLLPNLLFMKFDVKAVISGDFINGQLSSNMRLEYIDNTSQFLFVPTDNGMNLIDPESFKIEKQINLNAKILDYAVIDNIESDELPNKDLILFLESENMPSVVVYSLDSLGKIWTFTTYTTGYNDQSIKMEKKTPIFDYDINQSSVLLVSGYLLYNLDLKSGLENWHYEYQDNIWAATFIGDPNNDQIDDVAISVQPTNVIGLDGLNGKVIWEKQIAKPYQVKIDNKVLGDIKTNIWDLHYLNNNLIATGEDGYITKLSPADGSKISERKILDEIPNLLVYQSYLEGNKLKEISGISNDGVNTYKIINTRIVSEYILVTVFESNRLANFTALTPKMYLINSSTFNVIWEMDINKEIIDLTVNESGDISYFDGTKAFVFNLEDNESVSEILLSNPIGNDGTTPSYSVNPILYKGNLIVNYNTIYKLNIDDPLNPSVINTIGYFDGYDTIIEANNFYKLFYKLGRDDLKTYYAIECFNEINNLLWNYELGNSSFTKYLIIEGMFAFINDENKLITININDSNDVNQYLLPYEETSKFNVFTKAPDFNNDGVLDVLINSEDANFIILNGANLNEVLIDANLNDLVENNDEYYNFIIPAFVEDKKEMYILSSNIITVVSFDDTLNVEVVDEISLGNFSFWFNNQNISKNDDFDNDGYNDTVLRLDSESKNKVIIFYSSESVVGSIDANWDFSLYPIYEDLNDDGKYEIIVTTSGEDEFGEWHTRSEIVNPYVDFNSSDILFVKKFYEGNELTYNSQFKPLTIIDDVTGDGKKDVLVLVDRWGETYLQFYSLDDSITVKKVVPLNISYINKNDMQNSKIGSPGGYIDTFKHDEDMYGIFTIINHGTVTTKIMRMNNFVNMENVININGVIHSFEIHDDKLFYELFNKKNEANFITNTLELDHLMTLNNYEKDKRYKSANLLIKWDKFPDVSTYRIYVDGKLVEITSSCQINLLLSDGINNISIGEVFENGVEQITYFEITADIDDSNYNYIIYTVLLLIGVFILPMKIIKYRRREL